MEQQSDAGDSKDILLKVMASDVPAPKTETETSSEGLASNIGPETGHEKKLDSPSPEATTRCISRKPGSSATLPTSLERYKGRFTYTQSQYQISKRPSYPVKESGPIRSGSEKLTTKQSSEWISESLLDDGQKTKPPSPKKPLHKSSGDISQVPGLSLRPVIFEQSRKKTSPRKAEKQVPHVLEWGLATNIQERKTTTATPDKQSAASPVIKNFEPNMLQLRETLAEIKDFWRKTCALVDVYDTVASIPFIQLRTAGPTRPQSNFLEQEKVVGFAAVLSSLVRVLVKPDLSEILRQTCINATWPKDADLFESAWCLDVTSYEFNSKINEKVLGILYSISETTSNIQSFVRSSCGAYSLEILGYLISARALEKEFRNLQIAFTSVEYDIQNWACPKRDDSHFPDFHGRNIELANRLLDMSLLFFNLLIKYQTLNYEFAKVFPDRLARILKDTHIPKAPVMTSSIEKISQ